MELVLFIGHRMWYDITKERGGGKNAAFAYQPGLGINS